MAGAPPWQAWLGANPLDDPDLERALQAAHAGADRVRKAVPAEVAEKNGVADLVCKADLEADQAIHAELKRLAPEDAVLSEELAPEAPAQSARLWIVDPLDATTAFLVGERHFVATMVALLRDGVLAVAVIVRPFAGETWYAVAGKGTWCNGTRMTCSAPNDLDEAWVDMNQHGDSRYESASFVHLDQRLRRCCRLVTRQIPHSSVVCSIISGKLAAAVHDNSTEKLKQAVWDLAPQVLMIEEAGGVALDSGRSSVRELLERRRWSGGHVLGLQGCLVVASSSSIANKILGEPAPTASATPVDFGAAAASFAPPAREGGAAPTASAPPDPAADMPPHVAACWTAWTTAEWARVVVKQANQPPFSEAYWEGDLSVASRHVPQLPPPMDFLPLRWTRSAGRCEGVRDVPEHPEHLQRAYLSAFLRDLGRHAGGDATYQSLPPDARERYPALSKLAQMFGEG